MADISQSSSNTTTTTPTFYTNYLSDLASKGTAAGNSALAGSSAYDPNSLQNQAYSNLQGNVGNYMPGLAQAGQTTSAAAGTNIQGAANPYLQAGTSTSGLSQANPYLQAGTQGADQLIGNYMNPYTNAVVNQIGAANQQNIAQNLSPGITSGAVGSGQFGSQRGANALALGISNADIGALTQQTQAMQSGYAQALAAAQAQRTNQLTAGATAGQLQNASNTNDINAANSATNAATQQGTLGLNAGQNQAAQAAQLQSLGLADTNALGVLGGQKQAQAQAKVMQPLDVLNKQASIMSGAQLPTSVTQTSNASPLSTIAGLGSTAAALFQPGANNTPSMASNIGSGIGSVYDYLTGNPMSFSL